MSIEDRNLSIGTRLVAKYKKQTYVCTVEAGEDGAGIAFVLEDGKRYKSPSSASLFKKLPPNGLEEGQHRFFCTACQKSFITSEEKPQVCAEGHSANDAELTAPPAAAAVAADQAEVEA